jgi:hypothetical protein
MPSEKGIEAIIREAMDHGEFNDLASEGKPIDLSVYFNTPQDVRLAFSLLKNAGITPREVELLQEIAKLKESLETCSGEQEQHKTMKAIEERRLRLNLIMGRARR